MTKEVKMEAHATDTQRNQIHDHAEDMQRSAYGGMHFGAAFFGWLSAVSLGALLTALLAAMGSAVALITTDSASDILAAAESVSLAGALGLLVVFGIAYYAGGYVAGRMSRFDGGRQGVGVWLVGIIAAILLGLLGAALGGNYNLLQQLNLPAIPVDGQSFATGGLLTSLGILLVSLLAAVYGGKAGVRYHRRVDAAAHIGDEDEAHAAGHRFAHR